MRYVLGVVGALAAVLVAGCTSSSSPAPASSAPTAARTSSPAPTPTPTPASTPTPSRAEAKPLSPYEQDPAVKALRAWASQAGHTVNEGKYDDAALNALMTSTFAKTMKNILGGEQGRRYPGPVPFTPVKVTVTSSTQRDVDICVIDNGFSVDPKTGKTTKRHVEPIEAGAIEQRGHWVVSKFNGPGKFSCAHAKIKEQTW